MEKIMYRKVEAKLYHHFRRANQLERFEDTLIKTRERICKIREDIQNNNYSIENPLKSPSFDGMPKCDFVESSIEKALIHAYERLEKELGRMLIRESGLIPVINRISEEMELMAHIIRHLADEFRTLVEYRYKHEKSFRDIEAFMNIDHSTVQRHVNRVVVHIADQLLSME